METNITFYIIQQFYLRFIKNLLQTKMVLILCLSFIGNSGYGQTIITDNSIDTVANSSAILDLRSTGKGFLTTRLTYVKRMAINNPAEGLMVYQTDSLKGYYFYNGSSWAAVDGAGVMNLSVKTASDTLDKTESLVIASNDITLTLPQITVADNGIAICVKNMGSHMDLVTVMPDGNATIDASTGPSTLFRRISKTYVAYNGNWIIKDKGNELDHVYDVSPTSSWTSISEVLDFLASHMSGPSVIRLTGGEFPISATQTIDLPYPLTIQGITYSTSTIAAGTGLAGSPMFICVSECYFKMLIIDGSTLPGYGTQAGEDAIRLTGDGVYYEIKDNIIQNFSRAVVLTNNVELWMFENDVYTCSVAGIEVAAGTAQPYLKVSETDFYDCPKAVSLLSANTANIAIKNCGFYLDPATIGIYYSPATFSGYETIYIANNTWNNAGQFMSGFDFTRSDGRDANVFVEANVGVPNKTPSCKINVVNNASTTSTTTPGAWYKANWTNTSSITTNFGVTNNRMTYQPANKKDIWVMITGDLSVNGNNKTISVTLIKNGVTTTQYGETTIRAATSGQPYAFASIIFLENVSPGDYFELYCRSEGGYDVVTFLDVQWFANTK